MSVRMRRASVAETAVVSSILTEAALWLRDRGTPLLTAAEVSPAAILGDVEAGMFWIAERDGEAAGTLRFQLTDPEVWPEIGDDSSAFVHRVAVRRAFAGSGVAHAMLSWAAEEARRRGRDSLRLDCNAGLPRLRRIYEDFGFRYHSDRPMDTYVLARYVLPLDSPGRRSADQV
jgi:GNAT superfamily N-acetyltransferase